LLNLLGFNVVSGTAGNLRAYTVGRLQSPILH